MADNVEEFYIEQRMLGVSIGNIAKSIFPNISESAARGRLYRVRKNNWDESKRSVINIEQAFQDTSTETYTWRSRTGSVLIQSAAGREDKMTVEELRYLSQNGQITTRNLAQQILRDVAREYGYEFSVDVPDTLVIDRPTVTSTAGGVAVDYLFGRRKSDIQQARIRAQLKALGIKWNESYADFAGYGGL
tara:strand:+ start:10186 stop:10755 length:570 start_codon:yes stop_codon:yes gene_type:complete